MTQRAIFKTLYVNKQGCAIGRTGGKVKNMRNEFIITFIDVRTNKVFLDATYVSYDSYLIAWENCVAYALSELTQMSKYIKIQSIESR